MGEFGGVKKVGNMNPAFAKLLEYQEKAATFEPGKGGSSQAMGEITGVIFVVGDHHLTCSVEQVHEFLPLPAHTPVPGTKTWILGLANVRGDLVTIVDLGWFLLGARTKVTVRSRLLLASLRGRPVGLLVDEVFGQRNFVETDAHPAGLGSSSPLQGYVMRQLRAGSESWQELDLDILFTTADFLNGAAM
jgi:twitching motility protein PilI